MSDTGADQRIPAKTGGTSDDALLITVSTTGTGYVVVRDVANDETIASAILTDVPDDRLDYELAQWLGGVFRVRARELQ